MEQDPGGEHSESRKVDQETLQGIFLEYGRLAVLLGEISDQPADAFLEPGDDGTLDQYGQRVRSMTLMVDEEKLPDSLRRLDVSRVNITYDPANVLDGELYDQQVLIEMREEQSGITKFMAFGKQEDGDVLPWSSIEVDRIDENVRPGMELDYEEKSEVIGSVLSGENDLLHLDGPIGDFARSLYLRINEATSEGIGHDDINMLKQALPGIEATLADHKE